VLTNLCQTFFCALEKSFCICVNLQRLLQFSSSEKQKLGNKTSNGVQMKSMWSHLNMKGVLQKRYNSKTKFLITIWFSTPCQLYWYKIMWMQFVYSIYECSFNTDLLTLFSFPQIYKHLTTLFLHLTLQI